MQVRSEHGFYPQDFKGLGPDMSKGVRPRCLLPMNQVVRAQSGFPCEIIPPGARDYDFRQVRMRGPEPKVAIRQVGVRLYESVHKRRPAMSQ